MKGFAQKDLSITHHSIKIGEEEIKFKAIAGYMPLIDENEEIIAKIFFISYIKEPASEKRPVTFAFNGGPGSRSPSVWLQYGAPRVE
ncbi:MAG: hypothetical protein ACLFQV_03860 [Vulcanimicrobiota bacterium]